MSRGCPDAHLSYESFQRTGREIGRELWLGGHYPRCLPTRAPLQPFLTNSTAPTFRNVLRVAVKRANRPDAAFPTVFPPSCGANTAVQPTTDRPTGPTSACR